MTREANPSAGIEVTPATADEQPVLANLIQLYAHDFSEFHDVELGADGRYVYDALPLYWGDPDRHPFLVRMDGKLAGFVLVTRGTAVSGRAKAWDITEFFIVRGQRRRRIGTAVAHEVWRRFPGVWEVRVMESNRAGQAFWERAVAAFAGEAVEDIRVEKGGYGWRIFSFENRPQVSVQSWLPLIRRTVSEDL